MTRRGETLGLRVGRQNRWGYQGEKGWVWGRHGVTTRVELGSEVEWWEVERGRERKPLTAWETLRCHLAWGGPKDKARQPLTQIPLLANIPVLQIYGLQRNNNCQTLEAKADSFSLSSGDSRLEMSPNTDFQDAVCNFWVWPYGNSDNTKQEPGWSFFCFVLFFCCWAFKLKPTVSDDVKTVSRSLLVVWLL